MRKSLLAFLLLVSVILLTSLFSAGFALGSGEWSPEIVAGTGSNQQILSDSSDNAYVIFVQNLTEIKSFAATTTTIPSATGSAILMKKYDSNGKSILNATLVTTGKGAIHEISAFLDPLGRIHLAWISTEKEGMPAIYYGLFKSSDGTLYSGTSANIAGGSGRAKNPSVRFSNNTAFVLWSDDRNGNWEIFGKTVSFSVPQVSIETPADLFKTAILPVRFRGIVSNLPEISQIWYALDGKSVGPFAPTSPFEQNITNISQGVHKLIFYASSSEGTIGSATATFSYQTGGDVTAPTIAIYSPAGMLGPGTPVQLSWSASEPVPIAKYSLDGGPNMSLSGMNMTIGALSHGAHSLAVYAWDSSLNLGSSWTEFFVDIQAPQISISKPAQGANVSFLNNTIEGTISDDNPVSAQVYLNGALGFSLSGTGNFSRSLDYASGKNNLTIAAQDSLSNKVVFERIFYAYFPASQSGKNLTANTTAFFNESLIATGAELEVLPLASGKANLTITSSNNPGALEPETNDTSFEYWLGGLVSVDRFFDFNLSGNLSDSSYAYFLLKLHYSVSDLDSDGDGISEILPESLRILRYCKASGEWAILPNSGAISCGNETIQVYGSGVNSAGSYVWANLSHLSTYGIGGSGAPPVTTTTISGGGGEGGGGGGAGGGGGGGGGGGLVTVDSVGFIPELVSGVKANLDLDTSAGLAISRISFTPSENVSNATILVRKLDKFPSGVSFDGLFEAGRIYQNVTIIPNRVNSSILSGNAEISFRVGKGWLGNDDAFLYRYLEDSGEWTQLETRITGEEAGYVLLAAQSPGFSYFSIVGIGSEEPAKPAAEAEEGTAAVAATTTIATQPEATTTTIESPEEGAGSETSTEGGAKLPTGMFLGLPPVVSYALIGVGILAVLAGIWFLFLRKK
ncbi:MAG: PGF-pre-PGF domain-containing protein [archaeon]